MSPEKRDAHRLELKAIAEETHLPGLRAWLRMHRDAFEPAFPPRWVNNVYFDTPLLSSYAENLSGVAARRKVRVRWYGTDDRSADCVVEAKCKRAGVGWKVAQRLRPSLDLTAMTWSELRRRIGRELQGELAVYFTESPQPVILNRYRREYFATRDKQVRVTLDHPQQVYDQRFGQRPNLRRAEPTTATLIIEFKGGLACKDLLTRASAAFPMRLEKSSKYVDAVQHLLAL